MVYDKGWNKFAHDSVCYFPETTENVSAITIRIHQNHYTNMLMLETWPSTSLDDNDKQKSYCIKDHFLVWADPLEEELALFYLEFGVDYLEPLTFMRELWEGDENI